MSKAIPILIVGAGPVGLTTAAMLTHYGIPVRIIDKKLEATQTSNAVAVHARTLELLHILGLTEKFIAASRICKSMEIYSNKKHLASVNFALIESQYNYVCCVPQSLTEKFLIEYLTEKGVSVERSQELIGINQESDKTITVTTNTGTIATQWLVACDGYHSKVRELANIPYEGDDMKLNFMMIDAPVTCDFSLDSLYGFFGDDLTLAFFPMKESVRIIAEISHAPQYINHEPTETLFMQMAATCIPHAINISKPLWSSKFWIHERLAKHYLQGQILLAGDAAHAHSPAGGQGMNTGMHDAINLAWKLALVVQGDASEKLLTSYEEERRPVAQQVLSISGHMTEVALTKNVFLSTLRNLLMPHLSKLNIVQKKLTGFIAESAVNYDNSHIVSGHRSHHLHPGDRCAYVNPETKLQHILLDFKGDADQVFANMKGVNIVRANTLNLPGEFGKLENTYCILRPDFYIGYLGDNVSEVQQYFQMIYHP